MVTISQQTKIPIQKEPGQGYVGREKQMDGNSFLTIFDRSLKKPIHMQQEPARISNSGTKSLQSTRTEISKRPENSAQAGKTNTADKVQHNESEVTQLEEEPNQEASEGNMVSKLPKATEGEGINMEDSESKESEQAIEEAETKSVTPEMMAQSDTLLAIMDEIIAVLQNLAVPKDETQSVGTAEPLAVTPQPITEVMKQELEKNLASLVQTAEKLEGTKTSAIALDFAKKLQQLLGNESFKAFNQDDVQITVMGNDLEQLIGKMLHETENVKMHLVEESLVEITIPAMKAVPVETKATKDLPVENEAETELPVEEGKALLQPENAKSTYSGQMESSFRQRSGSGKFTGTEAEKAEKADSIQQTTANPIPGDNLHVLQKETNFTETIRAQAYTRTDVLEQVVEKAEILIHEDKSEMIMQLRPESLGKISLKVIHERGEIIAKFVAENEQVKAILEGNMQLLKDSLQKSGIAVQSLEVSVGQHGQGQHAGSDERQQKETGSERLMWASVPEKEAVQQLYRYRGLVGEYFQSETPEINLTA